MDKKKRIPPLTSKEISRVNMKAGGDKYVIRKGTTADIDELVTLYDALNNYLSKTINYPGWKKGIYPIRETAQNAIKESSLFILKKESKIAGSVILNHMSEVAYKQAQWGIDAEEQEVVIISTLVTHPQFMQQGVARHLITFAKEYAESLSMKAIRLDVSVNNTPAIKLYEQSGYTYIETVDLGLPYVHLKWFKLYEMVL